MTPGHITFSAITSSGVTTVRNTAIGLLAAWRLALARILAKASTGVPKRFMWSRPAAPNSCRAGATPSGTTPAHVRLNSSSGAGRSV
ncbi:hypothetical protein D3C72_1035260 [compost metagenome]